MNTLVEKLNEIANSVILDFIKKLNYPIIPGIATWEMIHALQEGEKFNCRPKENGLEISRNLKYHDRQIKTTFFLPEENIGKSREGHPRYSLPGMNDTIDKIFNLINRDGSLPYDAWKRKEEIESPIVKDFFLDYLKQEIARNQESILVSPSGRTVSSEALSIRRVMGIHRRDIHKIAIGSNDYEEKGPSAAEILEKGFEALEKKLTIADYYPSEKTMDTVFRTLYIQEVARVMGYYSVSRNTSLQEILKCGVNVFETGKNIVWKPVKIASNI